MRLASTIAIALGTIGCRQILGLEPGGVRGDAAIGDEDAAIEDAALAIDMQLIDAGLAWSVPEVVPGTAPGDQDPTLTDNMLQLYFTRGSDIYMMTRSAVDEDWDAPMMVSLSVPPGIDTNPEITGNGLIMLFASDRGAGGGLDIYASTRTTANGTWGAAFSFTPLNAPALSVDDYPGSGTADGDRVVLSSKRDNNQLDIFESVRTDPVNDTYGTPIKSSVSSTLDEGAAFLTNDGLTMYFAGVPTLAGPRDLYVVTRPTRTDPWGPRQAISELNTPQNDTDPWVSADGRHIYFASARSGSLLLYHASR